MICFDMTPAVLVERVQEMVEFVRKVELTAGWDLRGSRPNYGQHPPHLIIWVLGPKGAAVMNIDTGWYINDVAGEPKVVSIAIHAFLHDLHMDTDMIHDDCHFLNGEACVVEWEQFYNPDTMKAVKESGMEWCYQQLEALYLAHFESGPKPGWKSDPVTFDTVEGNDINKESAL